MHSRRNFLIFIGMVVLVLVLALVLRNPVRERTSFDDQNVIFQSNFDLSSVHDDNLVVFGSNLDLAPESRVAGDTSLIGDQIQIAGAVQGNLTVLGGSVTVAPGAQLQQDVNLMGTQVTFGGTVAGDLRITAEQVTLLPDAAIGGKIDVCGSKLTDERADAPHPTCTDSSIDPFAALIALRQSHLAPAGLNLLAMLVVIVGGAVLLTGASVLLVTFFPRQISHIEEAMRARPRGFVGVGIAVYGLEAGLFLAVILLLAVLPPLGLLLIPVFLILALLLLLLALTGLVTLTLMLGDWLLRRISKLPSPPLIAAVVGSLILSALLGGIALLPFGMAINLLLLGGMSTVGLGATLFTRIGTRPLGRTYFIQG